MNFNYAYGRAICIRMTNEYLINNTTIKLIISTIKKNIHQPIFLQIIIEYLNTKLFDNPEKLNK